MVPKLKNKQSITIDIPCTTIRQTKLKLNIDCWYVRSTKDESTEVFHAHETERHKIDILCLSKCGFSAKVVSASHSLQQFCLFYSGVENNLGLHGAGFLLSQRARNDLLEWEPIFPRLAKIRSKGSQASKSVLSAYTPTRDALDETKNDFYTELQTVTSAIAARDYLIVAGDFNARVVPKDQTTSKVLGNFGLGQHCKNGERLVNYALMNQLTVSNTVFQHKPSHLITWYSSDGVTKAQIDYELIRQRWRSSVLDSRSIKGADTGSKSGSDHKLIITKILLVLQYVERIKQNLALIAVNSRMKQSNMPSF
ncbi:craniofacial development protein 2-like [Artemia franciscana]|uniref:craniofacial development protein 2-like n=1 Tax=Artemia franciscana TaxID=6661 RepID=UPI0032DB02B4